MNRNYSLPTFAQDRAAYKPSEFKSKFCVNMVL